MSEKARITRQPGAHEVGKYNCTSVNLSLWINVICSAVGWNPTIHPTTELKVAYLPGSRVE